MKLNRFHVALALVAVLAVAGCGSSKNSGGSGSSSTPAPANTATTSPSPSSGGGAGGTLKIAADPSGQLKFDKSSLTAKAGSVTITMSNPSPIPHGVAVQGNGVNKVGNVVNQNGTSTVKVTLKPGKYTFYCPVPGHRQAGMQGPLTVQ